MEESAKNEAEVHQRREHSRLYFLEQVESQLCPLSNTQTVWHQKTQLRILISFIYFSLHRLSCFQPGVSCTALSLQEAPNHPPQTSFLLKKKRERVQKTQRGCERYWETPSVSKKSRGGQSCMLTDESGHSTLRQPDGHQLVSSTKVQLPFCCLTKLWMLQINPATHHT